MGVSACSRVIMKTALALVMGMFLVASGSAHGHRNKNRGGKRDECGVQRYTVSEKAYKQECHDEYETQCATSYVDSCATVTEVIKECHTASLYRGDLVPKAPYGHGYGHYSAPINNCVEVPVHNDVCTKEPVESCDQVAHEVPVAREVCTKEPVQTCSNSPRKVCRNVAVSVPRTVARRVCYGGRKGRY